MSEPAQARASELREITDQIRALRGSAAAVLYRLGVLLGRVDQDELWREGGYTSFTDYLERAVDVSETTARRCLLVARHFNEEIAARYGMDKLSRGLRYLELTGRAEQPGDLIAAELKNRGPDGRWVSVPFHEASGRQIDEAIRLELERRSARAQRAPEAVADRLERLSAALPDPPEGLRAAKRRVELTKTRKGEVALTFKQIPLSELRAFVDAVEREMLDEMPP